MVVKVVQIKKEDVLVTKGFDKDKTSGEIMLENNYFRVYNSGNLKYKFNYFKFG